MLGNKLSLAGGPIHPSKQLSCTLATLRKTEQTLSKNMQWAETYQRQMEDMLDRGVAKTLSEEEIQKWSGPLFYTSHLAVVNPKSNSTPVCIVFNSSQVHKGTLLNSCLAKGPDRYNEQSFRHLAAPERGTSSSCGRYSQDV